MESRISLVIVAVFAFSLITAGYGTAQGIKVGFVDPQKLMSMSEKAKAKIQKLQELAKKKGEELNRLREEMQKLGEEMEKHGPMLSEDKKVELARKMEYKKIDYSIAEQQAKAYMQNESRETEMLVMQDLREVVGQVRKKMGLNLIFNSATLLSADDAFDVTEEVAKAYDAAESKPRPAAQPRPAAGSASPKATSPAPKR